MINKNKLRFSRQHIIFVLLSVLFFFAASGARADVFDTITTSYQGATTGWFSALQGYAQTLFWLLAAIELAWAGITWALEKDNMSSFTAALVKKIMGIGFFYALLLNAGTWIPAIINSLKTAGQNAGGVSGLSPSQVVDQGIFTATTMLNGLKDMSLFDSPITIIIGGLSALCIVIAFIVIAGQLMIALIESYIAIGAGVLFLGFGGSRWTTDFTQKYVSYAFATGVKLFMLYLILGLGMAQANTWAALLATTTLENIFAVLGGSLILAFLAFQIPSMAAAMLSGSPSLTAGAAAATAATVAAGTVAAGGSVISPAMREARGGMQAVSSGYQANRAEGGSVLGSAVASLGSAGGQMAREAGRNMGSGMGMMKASEHSSGTLGGRASQALDQRTASAHERNAAMGPAAGAASAPPASGAGGLSGAPGASGAPGENGLTGGSITPGGTTPGQPTDSGSDAPPPVGSVPPPALPGAGSSGFGGAGAPVFEGKSFEGKYFDPNATAGQAGQSTTATPPAATGKAAAAIPGAMGQAASSAIAGNETGGMSSATGQSGSASPGSTAAPGAAESPSPSAIAGGGSSGTGSTSPSSSAPNPGSASSTGSGDPKTEGPNKDLAPSRISQVRPPQLPNDAAGGGTVHIKLNHSED